MTVKEIIKELEQCHPDSQVGIRTQTKPTILLDNVIEVCNYGQFVILLTNKDKK